MKKKITLKKHINPSIKVGDKVRMVDGSAFSYSGKQTESLFITQSYPELTGLGANIEDIDATVLAVNINSVATLWGNSSAYITDIKLSIGNGEFFTCSKFVEKVEDEQLLHEHFTLPKNWHVVVTEENQKEVSEWRFKTSEKICLGYIAGVVYKVPQDRYEKGHNPGDLIKKPNYDFGQEITTEQFRKYVLKKEEKKFPRMMLVSDDTNNWIRKIVHCYCGTLNRPWVVEVGGYKYAKEIPAPQPIYLTAQDISEGKGVGVDPKLIKFKE